MNDWEIIKTRAQQIQNSIPPMNTWRSFDGSSEYMVLEIEENKITIKRLSGNHNNSYLGKTQALKAVQRIKEQLKINKLDWTSFNTTKLKALVEFHPNIEWKYQTQEIIWKESSAKKLTGYSELTDVLNILDNASDDVLQRLQVVINKRKNQNKFRDKLLIIYDNKCAISGTGPIEVLEAAHIIDHSKSGINSNDNGLLLRADLHNLFDAGLLLIHPQYLTIHLHPDLYDSYYSKYIGKKLAPRVDLGTPNKKYLLEKWKESNWAAPLN